VLLAHLLRHFWRDVLAVFGGIGVGFCVELDVLIGEDYVCTCGEVLLLCGGVVGVGVVRRGA
jgi:hypothetical protein